MASNTSKIESEGPELRHLGFVRNIGIGIFFFCAWSIYDYAKLNHRLLTLPARMVEVPERFVLGPICNRFQNLPDDLLVLVDNMFEAEMIHLYMVLVDKVAPILHAHAPNFAKQLARPFKVVADEVINKAVIVTNEAQARGPVLCTHKKY